MSKPKTDELAEFVLEHAAELAGELGLDVDVARVVAAIALLDAARAIDVGRGTLQVRYRIARALIELDAMVEALR